MAYNKHVDLYLLCLCCLMLIGDEDKVFLKSLSCDTPLSDQEREKLILEDDYKGKAIVMGLMKNEIAAADAALKFNKMLLTEFD